MMEATAVPNNERSRHLIAATLVENLGPSEIMELCETLLKSAWSKDNNLFNDHCEVFADILLKKMGAL
jgi:hypothetical protein|tara:strand:- start:1078 stop:1281 length:204 start_codon:yes stop_codon:yes gene_type:complete